MPNARRILLSLGALTVLVVGAFVVVTLEGASAAVITILILIIILIGPLVWQRTMGQTIAARLQTSEEKLSKSKRIEEQLNQSEEQLRQSEEQLRQSEEQLRESEERLKFAIEGSNDGVWDYRADTEETYYNSRWFTMLGYEPGDFKGSSGFFESQIVHPEDRPRFEQVWADHVEGRTPSYETELRARTKTGEWIWILARGKVVERAEDGSPLRAVGTHVDISERKRIEEQLRESEERLKFAIEGSNDGVWDYQVDTGKTYRNSRWYTMLGYEPGELEGLSWSEETQMAHPEDRPRYEQAWADHMEGRTSNYEMEVRVRTKTGEWLWILSRGKIVSRDENNAPLRVVGTHVDISERKRAETRLRQQSAALNAAADGIFITDLKGTILWVNPAFSELSGYSFDEAVGQNPRVQKSGVHDHEFYEHLWQTISAGRVWSGEIVNKRKDGTQYTEEASITPVSDVDGEIINYVAIKRDITERKQMEAELEKARQRMADELSVGREIQMSMLPLIFPAFPERHDFCVFASLNPAREVGGDFYDFFLIDDDHFCFCVGDVSGKGVPAALFMAVTHALIQSRAADDLSPASILAHVNGEISRHNDASMFVSIFLAILDLRTGEFSYANAGHNPPYIKRRYGALDRLDQIHGPVIGAVEDVSYQEGSGRLSLGDMFFLFTDGVTEAMNRQKQLYGEGRLVDLLSSRDHKSAETLTRAVADDVRVFEAGADQADDVTILSLQFFGAPEYVRQVVTLEINVQNRLAEIDRVNRQFNAFADAHSIPTRSARSINLVFDELLNNIVSYAFEDEESHVIRIRIELAGHRLAVTIRDDGIPFNPFALDRPDISLSIEEREIGGLGVHLVSNVMDEVSYSRLASDNVVTLVKYLEPKD
jgi:sigma-B regulation protein RsbU (phosphoserine phosphatase)